MGKEREKNFFYSSQSDSSNAVLFGAFLRCFDQLTVGPLLFPGSCLDGLPCLALESCSGLRGAGRGFLQQVPSLIVNLRNNTMTIT